jgi:rod shape-determining protein MreC
MEHILGRYRNLTILTAVLLAQVLGLAVQVEKSTEDGSSRLIRVWVVGTITPFQKAFDVTQDWIKDVWRGYFALWNVRKENEELRRQLEQLRLEQVKMSEDANQGRRLQALLQFREQFIAATMPAQVIGSTGSSRSRGIYIDKGSRHGIRKDMPVITPDGVVGKVYEVYPVTSLVLQVTDESSGVGAVLENSRVQGIAHGSSSGQMRLDYVTTDQSVNKGERVLTSGGGQVFPKGLPLGTVTNVEKETNFWRIVVKPAAQLNKLEEVLVITRVEERTPEPTEAAGTIRAADLLAEQLPSVPKKVVSAPSAPPKATAQVGAPKPAAQSTTAGQSAAVPVKKISPPAEPKKTVNGTPAVASQAGSAPPAVEPPQPPNASDAPVPSEANQPAPEADDTEGVPRQWP